MQAKHVAILATCLGSMAVMIGGLPNWSEAFTPQFIGGALGVIAANIGALYAERPNERRR